MNDEQIFEHLGQSHHKLRRGRVWCVKCGRVQEVEAAWRLKHGWPKCCGETMTIDSPEEREAFRRIARHSPEVRG